MKKLFKVLSVLMLVSMLSCNNDDAEILVNPKSVTDCELTVSPTTLVAICMEGAEFALPNETLTFASKFTSTDSEMFWVIDSGNMEIFHTENSIVGSFTKSIVTIKFNSNFLGGVISVFAEDNNSGNAAEITDYPVALEIE